MAMKTHSECEKMYKACMEACAAGRGTKGFVWTCETMCGYRLSDCLAAANWDLLMRLKVPRRRIEDIVGELVTVLKSKAKVKQPQPRKTGPKKKAARRR
jgi:hypothetical protein